MSINGYCKVEVTVPYPPSVSYIDCLVKDNIIKYQTSNSEGKYHQSKQVVWVL